MAQYWEDWSTSTIGQPPTGWTARLDAATYEVLASENGPAGRSLKITDSQSAHHVLSWDALDGVIDFKARALMRSNASYITSAAAYCGLVGRSSGTGDGSSSHDALVALLHQTASNTSRRFVLRQYEDGSGANLVQSNTQEHALDTIYWFGLEVSGDEYRITLATPEAPDLPFLDLSGAGAEVLAGGWLGLFFYLQTGTIGPYYVYAVGVGTNGDEAPTTKPSSSALAGAAAVTVSAAADLTTAGANPVKGVSLTLHSGQTPQATVTGITACWWDTTDPNAFGAPVYSTTTASTDAGGVLTIDLDEDTALDIGQSGFLLLSKAGASAADDLVFAGRLAVQDVA